MAEAETLQASNGRVKKARVGEQVENLTAGR